MAGAFSNFLETALLAHIFRGTAYALPNTSVYVSLHTAAPLEDGTTSSEVSGNAYARAGVVISPTGSSGWTAPAISGTAMETSNGGSLNFATPDPAGWGIVSHFGIYDASGGGNLLFYGALTASKTINAGDSVTFATGALKIQLD